ncbi:copper amine oxidase N-terminal domain-containing protein [Paenibacillus donghaensis]|uniref:Copper amine oxidase-like N-terminal domain-containing protein n=1 Tax=Paenibacillus donghaensis TaxID=414771 RepID=A0A2Z2KPX1_9BACL|nr:copper amine oxidase N-terminal domain-containing protein [Paenibacillus donghaensis]ASA25803.1 hypothetical protein B9T62_36795 [Paenibacillus donghaensis]
MRRIMGRAACVFLLLVLSACTATDQKEKETILTKTNMDQVEIYPYEEGSDSEHYITYNDSSKEIIGESYIGLFINGSVIKNANLAIMGTYILVPLTPIAEHLDVQVKWDAEKESATVVDSDKTAEIVAGKAIVRLNGKEVQLDVAPVHIDEDLYVPLNFVTDVLQGEAHYFDGNDTTKPHIVTRMPHVMISRYPDSATEISKEEAVEQVREQLITAFEKKFGTYTPLADNEQAETNDDKSMLRKVITNLAVQSENDRYYVLPVVYDFWVDKYTGDVYTYYNGLVMTIQLFNPDNENALAFPG